MARKQRTLLTLWYYEQSTGTAGEQCLVEQRERVCRYRPGFPGVRERSTCDLRQFNEKLASASGSFGTDTGQDRNLRERQTPNSGHQRPCTSGKPEGQKQKNLKGRACADASSYIHKSGPSSSQTDKISEVCTPAR